MSGFSGRHGFVLLASLGLCLAFCGGASADECPVSGTFDSELDSLVDPDDHTTSDVNGNTIYDYYELYVLAWGLCDGEYYLQDDVMAAYESNLAGLSQTWLETYSLAEVFAAFYTMSQDNIDLWQGIWNFSGTYAPFKIGSAEPFARDGDLDGDGDDNETEYDNLSLGDDRDDYLEDVIDGLIRTLTISVVGSGTVTRDTSAPYYLNNDVEFTASPSTGYVFKEWSGAASGHQPSNLVVMDGNKTVTATFEALDYYQLTVYIKGGGSVALSPVKTLYSLNDSVTLTPSADAGWSFDKWTGDLTGTSNPGSVTFSVANKNLVVEAHFSETGGEGEGEGESEGERSFYMGFTDFPYRATAAAIGDVYNKIENHGDLVAFHLDVGVPWPEAYAETTYHQNFEDKIDDLVAEIEVGQKVYVAVCPGREALTGYRGKSTMMNRPYEWKNIDYDDQKVIDAYSNYCIRMIDEFSPDYFNYAIEAIPGRAKVGSTEWSEFVDFADAVYDNIKAEHPTVMVGLSGSLHPPTHQDMSTVEDCWDDIITEDCVDFVGISTYPYAGSPWGPGEGNPADRDPQWLKQIEDMAGSKPIALCETGFIAEDCVVSTYEWDIDGTEAWQELYVRMLLEDAQCLNAEFIIWWAVADFDDLWRDQFWPDQQDVGAIWRDIGLFDGEVVARDGLAVWDEWYNRTRVADSGDCGCSWLTLFDDELDDLSDPADHTTADNDGNTMYDYFELGLLNWGLCSGEFANEEDLMDAFRQNLNYMRLTWLEEYGYAELFAALYSMAQDKIDLWQGIWSLAGTYAPYEESSEEVFARGGDLDGDNDDNETEYDAVIGASGDRDDYITDATDGL